MATIFDNNNIWKYAAKLDLLDEFKLTKKPSDDNFFNFDANQPLPDIKKQIAAPTESTPKVSVDAIYTSWKKSPNPESMTNLLNNLQPTIDAAVRTYGELNNPLIKSKAKQLAINAINSFDPNNKQKATLNSWVTLNLQGLQRYKNTLSPIPVPERIRLDYSRIQKHKEDFFNERGRQPTQTELADATGLSVKRLDYVNKMIKPIANEGQYLEQPDDSDKHMPGIDTKEWQNIWLEYVYNDLDPVDKKIFDIRLKRGQYANADISVNDLAKELNISPSAVSQRSNKIAEKLLQMYELGDKL
jgi:DNA-directed RNA polymerase specialized sigma subunit